LVIGASGTIGSAFVSALAADPDLIICDEPTAALDAKNGLLVMEIFEQVARSPERAVLIVTHDNRIFSHANRIASLGLCEVEIPIDHIVSDRHPCHFGGSSLNVSGKVTWSV
jgi:putative ABC transport system ATP-binding protein